MKRFLWIGLGVAALGFLALMFKPERIPVEIGRVTAGALTLTVDEEGRTRVRDRFVVSAPIAGQVERINVREGDSVSRGTVVARIAPAPLDPRGQDVAAARLQAVLATARAADAAVVRARAALEQARRDGERVEQLGRQGIATPEQVELTRLAETSRAREVEAADFTAQAAAHDVQAAQAAMTGADPEQPCPDVVEVRSPIRGRVLRVTEQSERVVMAGAPLMEVGDPTSIEIVSEVLSSDAVRVSKGDPVMIGEWGGDAPLKGRVRTVEPSGFTKLSALGVEEQRVRVIVDLADRVVLLGDGFRVEVRIVVWETPRALKVPVSALFRRGTEWAAFAIGGGRARERQVTIGQRNALEAEVLSGLAEGDSVVLHPSDRLADGRRTDAR